jgi:hypothetical protein
MQPLSRLASLYLRIKTNRGLPAARALRASPLLCLGALGVALAQGAVGEDPWVIDFRYAPPWWQTSLCLPDDGQKTLAGKDGSLLYDYPGKHAGFGAKITAGVAEGLTWARQELLSPRVPIVRTFHRAGGMEMETESFAVAPPLPAAKTPATNAVAVERVGANSGQTGWASPSAACDPAFRNVAIGWGQSVQYRFRPPTAGRYTVVFGLCEGHHQQAGQRVLELQVEGKSRRTVDLVAEKGRNVPAVFAFDAADENGDGWIDAAVAAAPNCPDNNTILNVLWVFRAGEAPPLTELLAGQSARPPLAQVNFGTEDIGGGPPRHDLLLVHLRNRGGSARSNLTPTLTIESAALITPEAGGRRVRIGGQTTLFCTEPWKRAENGENRLTLFFAPVTLPAGGNRSLAFGVGRGRGAGEFPRDLAQAEGARRRAEQYWRALKLPYGHLEVPDPGVQALVDSSIRNIYQAREIKKGLPAFQVGPTCYRGLWVVDGSFLLEAVTYLGRSGETRDGVKYLMSFQRDDGGFMLIDGHWKETGIALWAIARHAELTGDRAWLEQAWPQVERGFAFIGKMRQMPPAEAPNAGLIPDGFSDGGLADRVPEYTNIYWTMAGMRAAVEAARWLGRDAQAADWQRQYDDFCATFRRAAARDLRTDPYGNRYLPIRMTRGENIPPQKAQWGFLHAVFPGKVFAADDPLVLGNMAMLKAVEAQGLVLDTGWLKDGLWNYFASFYAHAWLWLGQGEKAARTLYAFGNHASPLLAWREEQMPVGKGDGVVGDMPHNWASAEFIRLVRHSLVLERGSELHLFEAMPARWARPGATVALRDILTSFGPLSLRFQVSPDGSEGDLRLTVPGRSTPARVVLHLDRWSGQPGVIDLPVKGSVRRPIKLTAQ